jgi:hypothetical protein
VSRKLSGTNLVLVFFTLTLVLQETQLDELLSAYKGSSLEYNGTYYSAGYFFDTNPAPAILTVEALLGIALSAMGLGVSVIIACPNQCRRFW